MGSANVLSEKDVNNSLKNPAGTGANKADIKSMEYHRQVFKSKMEEEKYGHTTTITTSNPAVGTTSSGSSSGSGLGTMTVISAAVKPSLASSSSSSSSSSSCSPSQMIIHRRTLAGLPANPNAFGACSATQQYVSPSDNIMSPCSAKLNALKSRHAGKAKPKSLFAQASAKRFVGENVLGARNAEQASSTKTG